MLFAHLIVQDTIKQKGRSIQSRGKVFKDVIKTTTATVLYPNHVSKS